MSNDKYISDYIPAPIAKNENQRLEAVNRTGAMYLDQDELYDVYCYLAKEITGCLLYTSPSPRDKSSSRMPSSA